jgi:hypothetical protein
MKAVVFTALLALVLAGSAGCTSNSSGPYGDPGMSGSQLSVSSPDLHPIAGTDEGVELFKDEGSD